MTTTPAGDSPRPSPGRIEFQSKPPLSALYEPVGAVCGPPGPNGSSHGPAPGQDQHQSAQHATPLLALRLPPKHRHRRRRRGNKRHRDVLCPCQARGHCWLAAWYPWGAPRAALWPKSAPISPTRHAAPRTATAPQAPPSTPPPRKQTPQSCSLLLPSPLIFPVGRLVPLGRPTGRRIVKTDSIVVSSQVRRQPTSSFPRGIIVPTHNAAHTATPQHAAP